MLETKPLSGIRRSVYHGNIWNNFREKKKDFRCLLSILCRKDNKSFGGKGIKKI